MFAAEILRCLIKWGCLVFCCGYCYNTCALYSLSQILKMLHSKSYVVPWVSDKGLQTRGYAWVIWCHGFIYGLTSLVYIHRALWGRLFLMCLMWLLMSLKDWWWQPDSGQVTQAVDATQQGLWKPASQCAVHRWLDGPLRISETLSYWISFKLSDGLSLLEIEGSCVRAYELLRPHLPEDREDWWETIKPMSTLQGY